VESTRNADLNWKLEKIQITKEGFQPELFACRVSFDPRLIMGWFKGLQCFTYKLNIDNISKTDPGSDQNQTDQ
jgi:hypothetical protein